MPNFISVFLVIRLLFHLKEKENLFGDNKNIADGKNAKNTNPINKPKILYALSTMFLMNKMHIVYTYTL